MEDLFFRLDQDLNVIPADSKSWQDMWTNSNRYIKQETICGALVSSVFLGISHGTANGKPLVFETMIFFNDETEDEYQVRSTNHADCLFAHQKAIEFVRIRNTWLRRLRTQIYRLRLKLWVQLLKTSKLLALLGLRDRKDLVIGLQDLIGEAEKESEKC